MHQAKAEGIKLCARLKSDFELLKKTEEHLQKEKDSWNGILPMKLDVLDVVKYFESRRMDKQLSTK